MPRDELIENTKKILTAGGFRVSEPINMRSISFDIIARRDDRLLIIKILSNIDAFSRENAQEMKVLATALEASPLLIGERSSSGSLETGIVYSRFNVPIISTETVAEHILEEVPPLVFAAPGGLYVHLDSDLLHKAREERSISLGTLAEIAGVSRKAIQMYESGMGAMVEAALKLEEFLGVPIIKALDPFRYERDESVVACEISRGDRTNAPAFNLLLNLGYSIIPVKRSPFEALTKDTKLVILTGLGNDETKLEEKAMVVSDISVVAGQHSVIFVKRLRSSESIGSTALIGEEELKKIDEPDKLLELVFNRSRIDD
ncbi:MAG: putative transcriptional regulator [Candidatus Methanomethylophilaceae archaeon]|nr:putative transcriptional regulator [Candidatus Methanomethylophilaceae archaeon]MDI3541337.1 putative transcriptional regulator [Candidatus Methanomethylophilaceae archaeon]